MCVVCVSVGLVSLLTFLVAGSRNAGAVYDAPSLCEKESNIHRRCGHLYRQF